MKRYGKWMVLCVGVAVVAGVAMAMPGGMRMRAQQQEAEPRRGMRMGMMPGDLAAYGGNIFMVRAGELQKLDQDLEVVASVALPKPEGMSGRMGGPGMGRGMMMHGGRMQEYGPGPGMMLMMAQQLELSEDQVEQIEQIAQDAHEEAQAVLTEEQREKLEQMMPMMQEGGDETEHPSGMMQRGGMMQRRMMGGSAGGMMQGRMSEEGGHMMPGMHRMMMGGQGMPMMMGHMARLAADEKGVYLAIGGRLIIYDHDLNEQRSEDVWQ